MKNNTLIGIYALFNPATNKVFYIGAAVDPIKRLRTHISANKLLNIRSLRQDNSTPELIILEECMSCEVMQWESFWIDLFKSWGFNLENKVAYSNYNYGDKEKQDKRSSGSRNHVLWIPDALWEAIDKEKTGYHSRNQFVIDALKKEVKRLKISFGDPAS